MKIEEVLERHWSGSQGVAIRPESTVGEAARALIDNYAAAAIVVDRSGETVGLISEHDLVRAIADSADAVADKPVSSLMARNVIAGGAELSAMDAILLMKSHGIRNMPIMRGKTFLGMVHIRDLTLICENLQHEANFDGLTGIPNRRHFMEKLETEFERTRRFGHPLCVAMIDIDDFKRVNDTYGHDAGDKVLIALPKLIGGMLRTTDSVGRLGGEEFAIIFPETEVEQAKAACARILAKIGACEVDLGDSRICVTATIGLVRADPGNEDANEALNRADKLLYRGKALGKNRVVAEEPVAAAPPLQGSLKR